MNIVFDIGGTKTRIAAVKDGSESFGIPRVFPTPKRFDEAMTLFREAAQELSGGTIDRACGGIAGILDKNSGMLHRSHLADWIGKPLRRELEMAVGTNVVLENDAALGALGEATAGAGRNFLIVAYLTISTGVGGARVVDKKIDRNSLGFEPGHQIISACGFAYPDCSEDGYLEKYVSGSALQRRYHKSAHKIMDPLVWEETEKVLAMGLHNTAVFWSPDVIILGGGVISDNPQISLNRMRNYLSKSLDFLTHVPELREAELKDGSALFGALALLR